MPFIVFMVSGFLVLTICDLKPGPINSTFEKCIEYLDPIVAEAEEEKLQISLQECFDKVVLSLWEGLPLDQRGCLKEYLSDTASDLLDSAPGAGAGAGVGAVEDLVAVYDRCVAAIMAPARKKPFIAPQSSGGRTLAAPVPPTVPILPPSIPAAPPKLPQSPGVATVFADLNDDEFLAKFGFPGGF